MLELIYMLTIVFGGCLMRHKFLFIVFCVCAVIFRVSPVHAGWLDFFFPDFQQGPNPAETLKAPFANEDAVIVDMDMSGNAANITPLHMRHRTNEVITRWVQQHVPNMISYKAGNYKNSYAVNSALFNKIGLGEYSRFLQDKNFIKTLDTGRYDISGFIKDYPILLNEGAVDGSYRWLYQVNVMVTYINSGVNDYEEVGSSDAISQEFVINFQLGRHKDVENDHGVLIETWSSRAKNK